MSRTCSTVGLNIFVEFYRFSRLMSRIFSAGEMDERFPLVSGWQWLLGLFEPINQLVEWEGAKRSGRDKPEARIYDMPC